MHGRRAARLLVALLFAAGCASSRGVATPAATTAPAPTFVVAGGDQALALVRRDALADSWPQLVFREALPIGAVYVNLSRQGFSVVGAASALEPSFTELHPDVVAIWAGDADAAAGRPVADFRAGLTDLVELATRSGHTVVLMATLPAGPADYNDAIRAVAAERSLRLVDLTALVPAGGADLTPAESRAVADAFIAAYRAS